jgi:pimeloyl-ACP methyl ester carboxylesterase
LSILPTSDAAARESVPRVARPVLLALALLGTCAAIVLAGGAAAASQGRAPAAGAGKEGIDWHRCGKRLQCAKVRVALNWDHPSGRKIKLAVIRHLASRPGERIGSVFINPGGPGGSGVEAVRNGGAGLDTAFGGRFDIVSWDLRGSGRSTKVSCFANGRKRARFWGRTPIPTTRAKSRRFLPKTIAFARRCGARNGRLLRHLSTADSARDLDYLRRLVGDRRLTFYGASAGTLLGQTYANMFPGRVRAMVLDGVVDPVAWMRGTEATIANLRSDSDLVFEKFKSLCQSAGPGRCALAGHGPVAKRVHRLLRRLRRRPLRTRNGTVTYGDALAAITSALNSPTGWPQLAFALNRAANGHGSKLASQGREGTHEFRSTEFEPTTAIICSDSPARRAPHAWPAVTRRLTRDSRITGPVYAWSLWAPCASWPAGAADRYTGPWNASTREPILVMGNSFDPSTPYGNAVKVAGRLGNAVLLTLRGYGHLTSADPSTCIHRAIRRYVVDLVPPPRGLVCPADKRPFDPNFGAPVP